MRGGHQRNHRRSLRLQGYDYSNPGAYFVTMCTNGGICLFGNVVDGEMRLNKFGQVVSDIWYRLPDRYPAMQCDAFVVMPNHVHAVIIIRDPVGAIHESPLRQSPTGQQSPIAGSSPPQPPHRAPRHPPNDDPYIVRRRRMLLSKIIGFWKMNAAKEINRMRQTPGMAVWQRDVFEHIIRNESSLHRIRHYIADNPNRWHLRAR